MLVPAAVEDLHDAGAALDEAAGHDGAVRVAAGAVHIVAIHVEGGLAFFAEIGEFGHAALHAEGHLVVGDAGLDVGVADAGVVDVVEAVQRVEHGAAVPLLHAGRVFDKEHGISLPAQGHAGVLRGQEAAAPHAGEERLRLAFLREGGGEDDKGGQVIALAAQAVGEPGAEAGFAGHLAAGHDEGAGGIVINGAGVDGLHERDLIHDLRGVRHEFTDPHAALPVLLKLEHGGRYRQARLAAGHGGDALALADALGQLFVVMLT